MMNHQRFTSLFFGMTDSIQTRSAWLAGALPAFLLASCGDKAS